MICESTRLLTEKLSTDRRRALTLLWLLCSWNCFKYSLHFNEHAFPLIRHGVYTVLIWTDLPHGSRKVGICL